MRKNAASTPSGRGGAAASGKQRTRRQPQRKAAAAASSAGAAATATTRRRNPARRGIKTAERIAGILRQEIVTGLHHPGDKLLPERILQQQFDVSRPTLREAMRLLESESLIKISRGQHGGARVQKLDISVTARQVGMYLQMEGTTLADVLQARAFLEPPGAGLIAASRSLAVIDELRRHLAMAQQSYEDSDPRALAEAQALFSEVLTTHAGNKTLSLLAKLLHDIVRRQMADVTVRTHSREGVRKMQRLGIRAREKLVEIIVDGRVEEAEKFWRLHLNSTAQVLMSSYRAQMPIDVLQGEESAEA